MAIHARGGNDVSDPAHGSGATLFEVPFSSAMGERDAVRLGRLLDLSLRLHPKAQPSHETPGLARLDHDSGLFLTRRAHEGEWMLQARTWGHPAAQTVHAWHVLVAGAARQLDPAVVLPQRRIAGDATSSFEPLGHAAGKRFAHIRRRMAGLP
jgi:hypothetical protein